MPTLFRPYTILHVEDRDLRVSDLLNNQEAVLEISLSYEISDDMLVWHYEENGVYSIKTGYKVIMSKKNEDGTSASSLIYK
ncbi:hypothetical protein TorRG33x02_116440 [Trema orientale]|uniref:Uncharacterized protein n=1 Tax=Trema orientale TaxID=63057 RepID=A0A2P5F414_TREOI|nr:hypothetical protein TorRG33x02_116440 [Trema orientale]